MVQLYHRSFQHIAMYFRTTCALLHTEAALVLLSLFIRLHNRPSPPGLLLFGESQDLRTIIVIADIDRGLYRPAHTVNCMHPPYLTFRHWSGITPYTSTYVFAGSCVFGKQSPGNNSLRPRRIAAKGQALLLTYGRFFAEFLGDLSLVRLGLLALNTCVGLRYGLHTVEA